MAREGASRMGRCDRFGLALVEAPGSPQRRTILDCPVDPLTMDAAMGRIVAFVAEGSPHQVVTVNPEFIMRARADAAFRAVLRRADLATADGAGLLLAARILGFRLPQRVTGIDLIRRIAAEAAARGWRVFMLGAGPGIALRAAIALRRANPTLQVAGTLEGSPDDERFEEARWHIEAARPHALFVAFGAPAQDLWIGRHQPVLRVPLAMGVGGAFDFLAGDKRRAPLWAQRAGLEWAYRLWREPWRWRRMRALPAFMAQVGRSALVRRDPH